MTVMRVDAGGFVDGSRRLTVEVEVAVEEVSVVRLHAGSCADPAVGLLAVARVAPEDQVVELPADDREGVGSDDGCVCAVVTSAAGVDGAASEVVCP